MSFQKEPRWSSNHYFSRDMLVRLVFAKKFPPKRVENFTPLFIKKGREQKNRHLKKGWICCFFRDTKKLKLFVWLFFKVIKFQEHVETDIFAVLKPESKRVKGRVPRVFLENSLHLSLAWGFYILGQFTAIKQVVVQDPVKPSNMI